MLDNIDNIKDHKLYKTLTITSTIALSIIGILSAVAFFYNNIYIPKVTINSSDYPNGTATLTVGGHTKNVTADATTSVGGDWGVRLGYSYDSTGAKNYNRIELVKNGNVYETIV